MLTDNDLFVGDFETVTGNTRYYKRYGKTRIILGYIKNFDGSQEYEFTSMDQMFYYLETVIDRNIRIYFHNLSFDGVFIQYYLMNNKKRYPIFDLLGKNDYGFELMKQGRKIYRIKWKVRKGITIEFRCSLNILSSSVALLSAYYGEKKHEEEITDTYYDREPVKTVEEFDDNFREYIRHDVDVVVKAVKHFRGAIDSLNLVKWDSALTISGLSGKLQRRMAEIENPEIVNLIFSNNSYTRKIADKLMSGGVCTFNPNILGEEQITPNGLVIDINSAHPYSMTKLLPYGEIYDSSFYDIPETPHLKYLKIYVRSAVSIGGNVINLKNWGETRGRYKEYDSNFTCYYLEEEWIEMQKWYKFDYEIITTFWAHAKKWAKTYTMMIYNKRLEAKAMKSPFDPTYKTTMNAGFGLHGKRTKYGKLMIVGTKEMYDEIMSKDIIKIRQSKYEVVKKEIPMMKGYRFIKLDEIKTTGSNKLAAATITAYTRLNLYRAIELVGEENFLYCDTDSVYARDYNQLPEISETKLGAWKIENRFSSFSTMGAKTHMVEDEFGEIDIRYSGISAKASESLTKEEFLSGNEIINSGLKRKEVNGGIILEMGNYIPKKRGL